MSSSSSLLTVEEQRVQGYTYVRNTQLKDGEKPIEFKLVISPRTGTEGSEYLLTDKKYTFSIEITKDTYSSQIINSSNDNDEYSYEWVVVSPPGLPFQDGFSDKYIEAYGKTKSFILTPSEEGYSYFIQVSVKSNKSPQDTLTTKTFRYNSFYDAKNVNILAVSLAAGIVFIIFVLVLIFAYLLNSQHRAKMARRAATSLRQR